MSLKKNKIVKSAIKYFLVPAVAIFIISWLCIPMPNVNNFAVSPLLLDRQGHLMNARLSADGEWLLPVPLNEMGTWLPKVAVAIEDKRFRRHPGVDPLALGRAVMQNIIKGKVVSGASTITVQVVRLSRLRERTVKNKYIEFIGALKVDMLMGKDEILEIYLNRAPFGGNIRGAEAAARFYFDKKAKDLSLGESALLVAVLRGPSIYRPDKHPKRAEKRRNLILDQLLAKGVATELEVQAAKAEPVKVKPGRMPQQVWHLAERIFNETGDAEAWTWGKKGREYGLKTSIDMDMQLALENRLNLALNQFPGRISGAGAVMDNSNGEILAYVGNARWDNGKGGHWVDCASALRSPGSTLKPFIYLSAFADNIITPSTLLADTPLNLAGQAPRNFDEKYRGPVSAAMALSDSLNAPAVRVLRMVGYEKSVSVLRKAGFSNIRKTGRYYGDSLVLGGCEVNLWQLIEAYGGLARGGRKVKLNWSLGELDTNINNEEIIFPQGAAWLTAEALKDDTRMPVGLWLSHLGDDNEELAFKTGTSHGLRDAWLIGFTPDHTIGLWMGDPQGGSHHSLIAVKALSPAAAPLVDDIRRISRAHNNILSPWADAPLGVEKFRACAVSGAPAGPHCPASNEAYRVAQGAKSHPCRMHVLKRGELVTIWPAELEGWMQNLAQRQYEKQGPHIISPLAGTSIVLEEKQGQIPLRCEGAKGVVHWFVDEQFFISSEPDLTPSLPLTPGGHRVALIDGSGRTAAIDFEVIYSKTKDKDKGLPLLSFE